MTVYSPLSKSCTVRLVKTIPVDELVKIWSKRYQIDVKDFFENILELHEYECLESGLVFYSKQARGGDSKFYGQLQNLAWYYEEDKWEFQRALSDISPMDSVLEVGSGSGYFLSKLHQRKQSKILGLELNKSGAQSCQEKGLDVREELLDDFAVTTTEKFDVVCSFQVLEHVEEPLAFLEAQILLLKQGGQLIISVPNGESFLAKQDCALLNMPPHHLSRWTVKTAKYLAEKLELELKKVEFEPLAKCHVPEYVDAYFSCLPNIPKLKGLMIYIIRFIISFSVIRKQLKGHTLYMVFNKR